ncbi:MAG: tetratricopeptide repeat protein [Thermoflexales bacterium]|nr:tetratricopeptide repeat protein [Thermoflexales bacterium]
MPCPTCGTLNPTQARFCMGCGRLLVGGVVCGACQTLLPPHARFCYHCGTFLPQAAGAAAPQMGVPLAPAQAAPPVAATLPIAPTLPLPATPLAASLSPLVSIEPETLNLKPETPFSLGKLPPARPLPDLLPSLVHYLPKDLYEPLERRPKERDLEAVRDHLTALLATVKTYLPRPVVLAPQPAGEPAGGMYRGVFLFGDVSGFTPLSERLKVYGQAGAERITEIINALFSQLVAELFAHGGTLLKFGGDALLGLFPATTDEEMAAGALRAAQAAAAMQRVIGQDEFAAIDAAGETRALKIKCGISAGPYFAAHIGTKPRPEQGRRGTMAYVTTGHTVNQAEEAEGHANPGEVALTREAFELLDGRVELGLVTKSPDENFRLLLDVPPAGEGARLVELDEPPEGELMGQITYMVDRLDRLTLYLPTELVSRIVTNPRDAKITPEHRPVTVMFANYKGISKLIEKMGDTQADLITQHLNDYFVHMAHIVEKYEGTVARMDQYSVGDRLVIFFGAPRAHEDDPARAVYTALEMQAAVKENFAALRTATGVYRFEQRIGLNTGHLFAGNAGAPDLRQEYTLMGDDINMAARLMSNAGWGDIFISRKTRDHVAAYFELEDKGEIKVKGKEIRIPTFRVVGRLGETGRTRGLGEGDSPLVDRETDMALLKVRGQIFLKGRGQILAITGNSGLGKSRLARELKGWLFSQEEARQVTWIEARALSFSEQMTYWLVNQLMYGLLELGPDASEDDVLFTLGERGEGWLGEDAMDAVPYLANMMGLNLGEEWVWVRSEDPKVRQKQTLWAAARLVTAAARQRPLVILLDDLHWADEASLALIEHLLQVTDQAPLMLCLVFRARRDKRCWQLRDKAAAGYPHRFVELPLEPLDRPLSQQLLARLLPGADFAPGILNEILDKAAGNPFYLEEVVRSLIDNGAVTPDASQEGRWRVVVEKAARITVPDTLHAAIVARIDRLTEDSRQALQRAAVIGRQFRLEILRRLGQAEAEIDIWMAQLERGGLVSPTEVAVDPVYSFPDALVQEVAYDSLLVQDRQQLHRRVGETLESILGDKAEQGCELLAYHFKLSDDKDRAASYLEMSAKKARGDYANDMAIQHYADLLEIEEQAGDEAAQADALYQMGLIAYEIGDYAHALPWLERAVELYQAVDNQANVGWAVMYVGMVELKQANYAQSAACHQRALELAQGRQDTFQEGVHLTNLARVTMRLGQYDLALEQFEKSLAMKRQMKDVSGQGFALFYQGLIGVYRRHYDQAEAAFQAAIDLWQQVPGNERVVSFYHYGVGLLALEREQFERAEENLQRALELCTRLVLKAETIETLSALGQARLGLGQLDEARELSERAIKLLEEQKDVEERQQVYYNHYRVLAALQDEAAPHFLRQAYDTMLERANRIQDEEKRQIYLDKVSVNREINALWQNR